MSGSKFIELIRQEALKQIPWGIEQATVITPPPELRIRVDNMDINLEGDDLLICAHLLPATRYANITNDPPNQVNYNGETYQQSGTEIGTSHTTISFQDNVLQAGDRVVVMALPGGQKYLIWDKVVSMGD